MLNELHLDVTLHIVSQCNFCTFIENVLIELHPDVIFAHFPHKYIQHQLHDHHKAETSFQLINSSLDSGEKILNTFH